MNIQERQRIENRIAKAAIAGLLAAGYFVSVYDGEEVALRRSRDAKAIFSAMGATDEETLIAYRPLPTTEDRLRQIVRLGASIRATAWEAAQAQLAAIRYERRRGAA